MDYYWFVSNGWSFKRLLGYSLTCFFVFKFFKKSSTPTNYTNTVTVTWQRTWRCHRCYLRITFCKIVNYFVITHKATDKAPFFCYPNPPTLSQLRLSDKTRRGHEDCLQQKRTSLCRQNTGPCVNRVVKDICAAEKYGCTIG